MRVLAIDQGTSATKAVVFDSTAGIVAEVDEEVTGQRFDGKAVEQDPLAVWQSVLDAGRRALADTAPPVHCLGVGNQGETVLAWRRSSGEPVTPALVWQDGRAASVTTRLGKHHEHLHHVSGLPLDPYFAAPKIVWITENLLTDEQRHDADIVVTTIDAWIVHRLCGAFVTDASTASRTMLLDLDNGGWSASAADIFDIDIERQPAVVPCDTSVGHTDAFGPKLPLTGLIVDQQAALLAQRCVRPGDAKCTYGTGAFLLANLGTTARRSGHGLATSVAWEFAGSPTAYCSDGQVYTVGAAISWLQRVGLIHSAAELDSLGMSVPNAGGAAFVPSLAGIGAPLWNSDARGAFTGLSLSTTREHLVRAVGEGIAAQVALLARSLESDLGITLGSLRVDGGITRSSLVMQHQADLLGTPVEIYPHSCATALGVAAVALRGHAGAGAEDVVIDGWHPGLVFEPTADRAWAAAELAAWEKALSASVLAATPEVSR